MLHNVELSDQNLDENVDKNRAWHNITENIKTSCRVKNINESKQNKSVLMNMPLQNMLLEKLLCYTKCKSLVISFVCFVCSMPMMLMYEKISTIKNKCCIN